MDEWVQVKMKKGTGLRIYDIFSLSSLKVGKRNQTILIILVFAWNAQQISDKYQETSGTVENLEKKFFMLMQLCFYYLMPISTSYDIFI